MLPNGFERIVHEHTFYKPEKTSVKEKVHGIEADKKKVACHFVCKDSLKKKELTLVSHNSKEKRTRKEESGSTKQGKIIPNKVTITL